MFENYSNKVTKRKRKMRRRVKTMSSENDIDDLIRGNRFKDEESTRIIDFFDK